MNKYIIGGIVVVALVIGFFGGQVLAPKSSNPLRGYNPPVVSYAGFLHTFAASTTLATTDFCANANTEWLGTNGNATATLPAATSTFAACPSLDNFGSSIYGNIINDSTNTVAYSTGAGDIIKCETVAAGTSTVGTGGTCTSAGVTILASSTLNYQLFFDTSSSSLVFKR
jgi:hypothetical protein